jgi:uncharacterized membrane protein (DUF485 family)
MIPLKVARLKKLFTRFLLSFTAALIVLTSFGQISLTTTTLINSIQIACIAAIVGLIVSFSPVGEL